jgi:hypothetical protein
MWRVEAPKQANPYDFFMHEILAFAALHKAYQQPQDQRQPYYACGIHHQDLAIRGVREKLQNVTNEEAPAILATSTLLTLSVFASTGFEAQTTSTAASLDDIDSILNAFHLMQGMGHVLAMAQVAVRDSFLGPMFRDPAEPTASQPMLHDLKYHLPNLTAFIQGKTDLSEAERKLYTDVIQCFEPSLQVALPPRVDNRELRFLFFFPLHLQSGFMELIQQRKSGAIVILMYYTVVLLAAEPRHWFMEGWGHRVMKACHKVVDESWMPVIQWPLSYLEKSDSWELFEHLLNRPQGAGAGAPAIERPLTAIPQREPSITAPSTSHSEPADAFLQAFSLQRERTHYTVQMGSAIHEPPPKKED